MSSKLVERYFQLVDEKSLWSSSANWRFYVDLLFEGVALGDKRVLDVGAGKGLLGLYAACQGATHVVCLEPEAAGSTANVREVFHGLASELTCGQAQMLPLTFQDFDPGEERFDVVVVHNAINHLDEDACIRLHHDEQASRRYRELLEKMARLCARGAEVIIVDCDRSNFFAQLGLRCPFIAPIEWHKHQPPRVWAELLADVGFRTRRVRWFAFNCLGRPGQLLLGNRVAAYFLGLVFCLEVVKV